MENEEGVCEELLLIKYPLPEWKINLHTDNKLTSIMELHFFPVVEKKGKYDMQHSGALK